MFKNTLLHCIIAYMKIFGNLTFKVWGFLFHNFSITLNEVVSLNRGRRERQSNSSSSGSVDSVGGTMNQCFPTALVTHEEPPPTHQRCVVEVPTTLWVSTASKDLLQDESCLHKWVVWRTPSNIHWQTSKGIQASYSSSIGWPWPLSHFFSELHLTRTKHSS